MFMMMEDKIVLLNLTGSELEIKDSDIKKIPSDGRLKVKIRQDAEALRTYSHLLLLHYPDIEEIEFTFPNGHSMKWEIWTGFFNYLTESYFDAHVIYLILNSELAAFFPLIASASVDYPIHFVPVLYQNGILFASPTFHLIEGWMEKLESNITLTVSVFSQKFSLVIKGEKMATVPTPKLIRWIDDIVRVTNEELEKKILDLDIKREVKS